ncbi:hypothetical protein FRC11_007609 [Ceratobasidium sp. 423]|nr:hypothetical protein FRC11_007609 [Ceratobasidium sp. 423]
MAAVSHTRRSLFDTTGARRRFLAPALHTVTTVARMVDVPGLRQHGIAELGLVKALKAPKQNRAKVQDQIDNLNQAIASVRAEFSADAEAETGRHTLDIYLCEAQVYVE